MGLHNGDDLATKAGLTAQILKLAEKRAHGRRILKNCLKVVQVQRQELC